MFPSRATRKYDVTRETSQLKQNMSASEVQEFLDSTSTEVPKV